MTRTREVATQGGLVLINKTDFTAQATVSFNNVFNSDYDNYKILCTQYGSSNGQNLNIRARNNTTDYAGAGYYSGAYRALYTGSNSNLGVNGGTVWFINYIGTASGGRGISEITFRPVGNQLAFESISSDDYQPAVIIAGGRVDTGATVNGFTISASSGTLTGSVSIYGYKK